MPVVKQVWNAALQVYGADKLWKQIASEGIKVARCTVELLMRRLGLRGVERDKVRAHHRQRRQGALPADAVNRQLRADRPTQWWVVGVGHYVHLDLARLAVCSYS